jgi:MFS family permease
MHLLLGGSIFVLSLLAASFVQDFILFLVFYAVLTGLGYGIIYMLPLKSAWSFFPNKKGTVGGIILASHSFGAIGWSLYTATTINPNNETPTLHIQLGSSNDLLFSPMSEPVQNVASTLRLVFYIELALFTGALILMNKKKVVTFQEDLQKSLIQNDHQQEHNLHH